MLIEITKDTHIGVVISSSHRHSAIALLKSSVWP